MSAYPHPEDHRRDRQPYVLVLVEFDLQMWGEDGDWRRRERERVCVSVREDRSTVYNNYTVRGGCYARPLRIR